MSPSTPRDENMIAALKRERAAYVARGDDDRIAQVDEQLRHYGYEPAGQGPVTDEDGGPVDRTAQAGQRTADAAPAPRAAAKTEAAPPAPAAATGEVKKPAAAKKLAATKSTQAPPASPSGS